MKERQRLAQKAFQHVAIYDTAIAEYLREQEDILPEESNEDFIGFAGVGMIGTIVANEIITQLKPHCSSDKTILLKSSIIKTDWRVPDKSGNKSVHWVGIHIGRV